MQSVFRPIYQSMRMRQAGPSRERAVMGAMPVDRHWSLGPEAWLRQAKSVLEILVRLGVN